MDVTKVVIALSHRVDTRFEHVESTQLQQHDRVLAAIAAIKIPAPQTIRILQTAPQDDTGKVESPRLPAPAAAPVAAVQRVEITPITMSIDDPLLRITIAADTTVSKLEAKHRQETKDDTPAQSYPSITVSVKHELSPDDLVYELRKGIAAQVCHPLLHMYMYILHMYILFVRHYSNNSVYLSSWAYLSLASC